MTKQEFSPSIVQMHLAEPIQEEDKFFIAPFQYRKDGYFYEGDDDPLDEIATEYNGFTQEGLTDSFYREMEAAGNTFAEVYLHDEVMYAMFGVLYGKSGYFIHTAHAKTTEDVQWAAHSDKAAEGQVKEMIRILKPVLNEHNLPEKDHGRVVNEIIEAFKERFSGVENAKYRNQTRRRLAKIALGSAAA